MRKTMALCAALALVASVDALEGKNGYTATQIFTEDDVRSQVRYLAGFSGIEWGDLVGGFQVGAGGVSNRTVLATDASGGLFFRVQGGNLGDEKYTGVIHYDGANFHHLVQDVLLSFSGRGTRIELVTVSPVTFGLLTADHPVITRFVRPVGSSAHTDLVSIDPATSTETLVYSSETNVGISSVAIDSNGAIFAMLANPASNEIVKLTYNGSGYDESVLASGFALGKGMTLGADGALYAFEAGFTGNIPGGKKNNDILRVDPATGATSFYADVPTKNGFVGGWTWDSAGNFWMGVRVPKKASSAGVITAVEPGATVSPGDKIAPSQRLGHAAGSCPGWTPICPCPTGIAGAPRRGP